VHVGVHCGQHAGALDELGESPKGRSVPAVADVVPDALHVEAPVKQVVNGGETVTKLFAACHRDKELQNGVPAPAGQKASAVKPAVRRGLGGGGAHVGACFALGSLYDDLDHLKSNRKVSTEKVVTHQLQIAENVQGGVRPRRER